MATSARSRTQPASEATRRLVRELRQDNVPLETLERHAETAAESTTKARGLIDLYRRYLDGRADRYDGDDALAVAEATRFDGTELLAYGVGAGARSVADSSRSSRRRSR